MTSLWRNMALAGLVAGGAALMPAAEFTGILMDTNNSSNAELRIEPGGLLAGGMITAEAYTKETALKPENQKAGYGIFTEDNKFVAFDEAGSRKALAALKTTKREDDLRITVTGEKKGDRLQVATIRILPPDAPSGPALPDVPTATTKSSSAPASTSGPTPTTKPAPTKR